MVMTVDFRLVEDTQVPLPVRTIATWRVAIRLVQYSILARARSRSGVVVGNPKNSR